MNQALKLKPDFIDIYYNRGIINLHLQQYDQAINDLSKAIEEYEDDSILYRDRGLAYYYKKNYRKALSDIKTAISLDHIKSNFYALVTSSKISKSNFNKELEALKKAKENFKSDTWLYAVAQYLVKEISVNDLVKLVDQPPGKKSQKLSELYCFAGYRSLWDGDKGKAKAYFKKSYEQRQLLVTEYYLSRYELLGR